MTEQTAEQTAEGAVVASPDIARGAITAAPLDARIRYAREIAHAGDMLPRALIDRRTQQVQVGKVLLLIETGQMLGIHPVAALNGVNVIEGKPTISPALMTALVRRAGHKVRVSVSGTVRAGDVTAVAEVIRSDDPDFTYRATWDLERAARAGLCTISVTPEGATTVRARSSTGKVLPWEAYTEAMLKARAIGEVCRESAEDCLCGVHYTPEELGATVNVDGDVIVGETLDPTPQQQTAPPEPTPLDDELATMFRDAVLTAATREQLEAAWGAVGPQQRARLAMTSSATVSGEACTALELFVAAADAVKAGTAPLRAPGDGVPDGPGDEPDGPQAPTPPREGKLERGGRIDPDVDPWATGPQDVSMDAPAPGDEPTAGVPAAEAILGGTVIDRVDATPAETARADQHDRRAARVDHDAVEEDRDERRREHDVDPGEIGRDAMAAARARLREKHTPRP